MCLAGCLEVGEVNTNVELSAVSGGGTWKQDFLGVYCPAEDKQCKVCEAEAVAKDLKDYYSAIGMKGIKFNAVKSSDGKSLNVKFKGEFKSLAQLALFDQVTTAYDVAEFDGPDKVKYKRPDLVVEFRSGDKAYLVQGRKAGTLTIRLTDKDGEVLEIWPAATRSDGKKNVTWNIPYRSSPIFRLKFKGKPYAVR